MTDDTQNDAPGRRPDFVAYTVRESRDGKGYWTRIGAAWQHRNGHGYDVQLETLPLDGRVTLRELRDERMQGYEEERRAREAEPAPERGRDRARGQEPER